MIFILKKDWKIDNKNIKIIPKNTYEQLTYASLAHWNQEDGSFNKTKGNLTLCTDSFIKSEVETLIKYLSNKFKLSCGLKHKTKDQYRIRINKSSIPDLTVAVKPYFEASLLYKLGFLNIKLIFIYFNKFSNNKKDFGGRLFHLVKV